MQSQEVTRLVTYGCSYTYGHGLPDCIHKKNMQWPGEHPSFFAWPRLLSKHLNIKKVANRARCGSSIKELGHKVLQSPIEASTDFVIIMWTNPFRVGILNDDDSTTNLGHWGIGDSNTKNYYKHYYNDLDMLYNYASSVIMCNEFLKSEGVRFLTIEHTPSFMYFNRYSKEHWYRLCNFQNDEKYFALPPLSYVDYAVDGKHPGIKQHEWYAQVLKNQIIQKKILTIAK